MRKWHEIEQDREATKRKLDALRDELKDASDKVQNGTDRSHGMKERAANLVTGVTRLEREYDDLTAEYKSSILDDLRGGTLGTESGDGNNDGKPRMRNKAATVREYARDWSAEAADSINRTAKQAGVKALTSGSVDVPAIVPVDVTMLPTNPARVVDLLTDRLSVTGNEFEFLRQSVRTNNAAPVADNATKPTSVFTVDPILDRVRVVAHLSEPVPERLFQDHRALLRFLEAEMANGVLDALEAQVVSGDGTGENMAGLLNTAGIGATPFATDIATTCRKARTKLQNLHEDPSAWVLNPADAEAFDLLKEGADGTYLSAGPGLSNIFGDIPKVVSTSVPAGVAILGDFSQLRLYVRVGTQIDADRSGALFKKNQVLLRAEGRFGVGVLRPQAFTEVDLTSA